MSRKDPGFNRDNIVMIDADQTSSAAIYPLFRQSVLANPDIAGIAGTDIGIGEGTGWSSSGFEFNGVHKDVFEYFIDEDYLNVLGMELLAGRNFNHTIASDSVTSVIVNESMMKDMGWTIDNAVGQQIKGYSDNKIPVVIGVVKDFHFQSFSVPVKPQMFHHFAGYTPYKYFVRIKPGNPSTALSSMQASWNRIVQDLPFRYSFLDENLDNFYKAEQRWSNIIGWAGGISIFLACLGLFGLASLAAVNRTKEIGIRKVLGASHGSIVTLLSRDFLKLVMISLIIAAPLAWYFMNRWLQDFAFRVNIGWWIFVVTGMLALGIAFLTTGIQALRAALANPVKSLRTE
jgi:putative ABC transport system permease protein